MSFTNVTYKDAPERANRVRYKNYRGEGRSHKELDWNEREFIAWDGEGTKTELARRPLAAWMEQAVAIIGLNHGEEEARKTASETRWAFDIHWRDIKPQPYVLLANSKGEYHATKQGLDTVRCLEFMLNTKERYPHSIHVGFGFNYDIAQILKDLMEKDLWMLYQNGKVRWLNYYLKWMPGKSLIISDRRAKGRSITIYDVFAFFQTSFLEVCKEYLGKDDPRLQKIEEGKAGRSEFEWDELHQFILPYNKLELEMLVEIMSQLRTDFHNIELLLGHWHGPGAVANKLFAKHHIRDFMSPDIPKEVKNAAQHGYAGGRFEQFQLGRHQSTVYEYDIRSAYPAAATTLPNLSGGTWHFSESFKPGTFGIWYCGYRRDGEQRKPQPLFCRAKDGSVSFPTEVYGWYWTPEASLVPDSVECGYYLEPATDERPFSFINEMYEQRRAYKTQGNPTQRAIKLCLNSLYGKLAQTLGGIDKAPSWHQLEWAGWITSYTRAVIYNAIMLNPQAIIAAETDAVFSTEPLPLDIGHGLGQWECSTFKEITYLQNGYYYAVQEDDEIVCKYRGMDRDRATKQPVGLPYRFVVDHLSNRTKHPVRGHPPLLSSTTRFVNIGMALLTNSIFRTWETTPKTISIDQSAGRSKRYHMIDCEVCKNYSLADCLHPMNIGGYSGYSYHHRLPWIDGQEDDLYALYLSLENADLWQ